MGKKNLNFQANFNRERDKSKFKGKADEELIEEAAKQYGFPRGLILEKILETHGFTLTEYESKIKGILEQTKFKGSYRMKQTDIWMKITLKK